MESLVLCRRRRRQQQQGVKTVSDPLYHTSSLSTTPVAIFTFVLILEWIDRRPCSVSHSVPSLSIRTREGIVPLPRLRGGGTRSRPAGRPGRPGRRCGRRRRLPARRRSLCMLHAMGIIPKVKLWFRRGGRACATTTLLRLSRSPTRVTCRVLLRYPSQAAISTRENSNIHETEEAWSEINVFCSSPFSNRLRSLAWPK